MSLALQADRVISVLLQDGWHEVEKHSFSLDAYEYLWGEQVLHGGGNSNICATGFAFQEGKTFIAGPLSAIHAVRFDPKLRLKAP